MRGIGILGSGSVFKMTHYPTSGITFRIVSPFARTNDSK